MLVKEITDFLTDQPVESSSRIYFRQVAIIASQFPVSASLNSINFSSMDSGLGHSGTHCWCYTNKGDPEKRVIKLKTNTDLIKSKGSIH